MRTINAPGVEWREIDKSGYSPAMVGTGCFIPLFSDKGEPYRPMEFTSRSAFEKYYGTPDNEAERYGYAAACEVLNQNGRLWCARLPYDNAAFEKVVGIKYSIQQKKDFNGLSSGGKWYKVHELDSEIKDAALIVGGRSPVLYDLSSIDEYRTDEARVPANTFLIVDTTNATYARVPEDSRMNQKREVIGIVPIVTTAANAMYAQSLISISEKELNLVSAYESICGGLLSSLYATSSDGSLLSIDGQTMQNGGLLSSDVAKRLNTTYYYENISSVAGLCVQVVSAYSASYNKKEDAISALETSNDLSAYREAGYTVNKVKTTTGAVTGSMRHVCGSRVQFDQVAPFATEAGEELFNHLSTTAQDDRFIYQCREDAETVGTEIAKDALTKPCIMSALGAGTVETHVEDVYTADPEPFNEVFYSDEALNAFVDRLSGELSDLVDHYEIVRTAGTYDNYIVVDDDYVASSGESVAYYILSAKSVSCLVNAPAEISGWHNKDGDDAVPETMALDAANYFSTIQPAGDGGLEPDHLKDIGVVVYRCYLDPAEGNKVSWEPVEAFCGSLCKDDKDPNTGVTKFIDTIVNTNSEYINFFSNCFTSTASKKFYKEECDILLAEPCTGAVLGLYSPMTKEDISITKSIYDGLNKAFEKIEDINKLQIDIVCDAGISNIASYLKAIFGNKGPYDLMITDDLGNSMLGMWKCKKYDDPSVKTWKTVVQKLDNFCKNVRKDCMFVTECPRPLVLQGQKKIIRDTKPANTIDANILPYLPAVCGLNTNYGAGYLDWFEMADDYTGDFFWCPPSIKAMGVMINCDVNYWYWDAPAGLNRGVIQCTDVAFSPTIKQAGPIYEKNWNYAIHYPNDGVVLEGQKTFQTKPSAFDRINVRRLFLRLERAAYQVSRYFVYEGHTAYTRQRLIDALDPYFKEAKNNGGIYDYIIKCDDENNPPDVIDRNELHVQIAIKPVKTIEFITLEFICARTGASWSEVL